MIFGSHALRPLFLNIAKNNSCIQTLATAAKLHTQMSEHISNESLRADVNIYTYHCICTNLLLATTYRFSELPRRSAPGIDQAYILPCPPQTGLLEPHVGGEINREAITKYTLLTSLESIPGTVTIVRREDGFEKRYLLTCNRCELVYGYQLDESQFANREDGKSKGRREDVIYILPGGIVSTNDMMKPKGPGEAEVGLSTESSSI